MKTTLKGIFPDMTNDEYHAHPAIGSSTLSRARRSWAHALTPFPKTEALDFGAGFHALVGEPILFPQLYARLPECDRRTKEGKEIYARFTAENQGKTILTSEQWTQLDGMLKSLLSHKNALGLLTGGAAEQSYFWTDPESGVMCKCRPDYLLAGKRIIVDLKSAMDGSEPGFRGTLMRYGRHIQTAFYLDGLTAVTGEPYKNFVHLVVEKVSAKDGLHPISLYSLDDESIDQGRREYKKLLMDYAMCQKVGEYPSYPTTVQSISIPAWGFTYE